jgi:hypothetical protein
VQPPPPPKVTEQPAEDGLGGRTLADVWDNDKGRSGGKATAGLHARSERADAGLLAEMARERVDRQRAQDSDGSARDSSEKGATASHGPASASLQDIVALRIGGQRCGAACETMALF